MNVILHDPYILRLQRFVDLGLTDPARWAGLLRSAPSALFTTHAIHNQVRQIYCCRFASNEREINRNEGTSTSHSLSKRPAFVTNVQYSRETMLAIRDLGKTYSSGIQALKGISLNVPPGMFGLLGPNGAGKTTRVRTANWLP